MTAKQAIKEMTTQSVIELELKKIGFMQSARNSYFKFYRLNEDFNIIYDIGDEIFSLESEFFVSIKLNIKSVSQIKTFIKYFIPQS